MSLIVRVRSWLRVSSRRAEFARAGDFAAGLLGCGGRQQGKGEEEASEEAAEDEKKED